MIGLLLAGVCVVVVFGWWNLRDRPVTDETLSCTACLGTHVEHDQVEDLDYWTCLACGHVSGPGSAWLAGRAEAEAFIKRPAAEQRLAILDLVIEARLRITSHEEYLASATFQRPPMEILAEIDDQLGESLLDRAASLNLVAGFPAEPLKSLGLRPTANEVSQALIPMVCALVQTSARGATLSQYQKSMAVWPGEALGAFMGAWVDAGLPFEFHHLMNLMRRAPDAGVLGKVLADPMYGDRHKLALALLQGAGEGVALDAARYLLESEEPSVHEPLYRAWLGAPTDGALRGLLDPFAEIHQTERGARSLAVSLPEAEAGSQALSLPIDDDGLSEPALEFEETNG